MRNGNRLGRWLWAILLGAGAAVPALASEQRPAASSALWDAIARQDHAVFEAGYNRCDIEALRSAVSDSLEFYHDEHGITVSKEAFVAAIRDGICKLDYKARRELVPGTMSVFPLKNNGTLYGAIQTGRHRFYAKYPGQEERPTAIARFTIVWLLEEGHWKMARALSYDHQTP